MTRNKLVSKTRVTAKDIAAIAGVSQSTVSRVLSSDEPSGFISEETTKRVREIAKQLHYKPNPIARALRGEGTNMIGLVVREIADPFFAGLIEILSDQIRNAGYTVVLGHAHSDSSEGLQMAKILDSRQCDGIIFLGDLRDDQTILQTFLVERNPVVALCRGKKIVSVPTVNSANTTGMRMLLDHLYGLGHKHIAFIDGGWLGDIQERREFFLKERGEVSDLHTLDWIQADNDNPESGCEAMTKLLESKPRPTAVMASDDFMAIGVIKAIFDAGLRIPDDISVTGFDDISIARFTIPALTTVRQPIEEMGRTTIKLLIDQIKGNEIAEENKFVQLLPELIIRSSTGPVPQ